MKLIALLVSLVCASPLCATEVRSTESQLIVDLEGLVKTYPIEPSIRVRVEKFLRKKGCALPEFYARLIDSKCTTDAEKKRWAGKLVIETNGKSKAVSSCGAVGPWQLHPTWFKVFHVTRQAARKPLKNLELCKKVYSEHLLQYHGNVARAEIAYSGGSYWYPTKINQLMREV